ncbi:Mut7-C RNAse domain-containing protein [Halomonas sp. HP20-15]|uniref:Mut7-C RNAse domain-containing protein n=1 Tax=Halomonas sp. HP20-15 TaxID=3085901 RepID=UPI002981EEAE|nr:Mut7-C RNAse domain-containing protein [Halomonas sp. HP20-15]MDW5378012.1 Mut7-C RNAse domain-containing protein [Halomonas sp. HP20-15]
MASDSAEGNPLRPVTRFVADAMLARLARWLRALGFDTLFDPAIDDPQLVQLAERDQRWLLTRDRALVAQRRPSRSVLIAADAPLEQLREVVERCQPASPAALFTRCLVCNCLLQEVSRASAAPWLPERARTLPDPVRYCPRCQRHYWPGTHTWRMRERLARTLPEWFSERS